jgi:DNA-binding transcriptional LysR family regulator
MKARTGTADLHAFLAVARERSFTRAAAQLGVSQSALSHTIRSMEQRLGVRLLDRTTRSVSPTEAGQRLLAHVGPRMDEIEAELDALSAFRETPAGTIRINSSEQALRSVLWPVIDRFARTYPDIKVEVDVENGLIDIVEHGYDAGVRLGEQVARDMIATRIAPDWRMAVIGTPAYLATRGVPLTPDDLTGHNCINLRLVTYGGLYAWEFEKGGRRLNVRVDGQLAFNSSSQVLTAALAGHGLACVAEEAAAAYLESGAMVQVLADWMPTFAGYHLYYPSRQHAPAFQLFVDAIRYRS